MTENNLNNEELFATLFTMAQDLEFFAQVVRGKNQWINPTSASWISAMSAKLDTYSETIRASLAYAQALDILEDSFPE